MADDDGEGSYQNYWESLSQAERDRLRIGNWRELEMRLSYSIKRVSFAIAYGVKEPIIGSSNNVRLQFLDSAAIQRIQERFNQCHAELELLRRNAQK